MADRQDTSSLVVWNDNMSVDEGIWPLILLPRLASFFSSVCLRTFNRRLSYCFLFLTVLYSPRQVADTPSVGRVRDLRVIPLILHLARFAFYN